MIAGGVNWLWPRLATFAIIFDKKMRVRMVFSFTRKQQVAILAIAALLVFIGGYQYATWRQGNWQPDDGLTATGQPGAALPSGNGAGSGSEVVVHVSGAVQKPGVYHLPAGSRVEDLLNRAGLLPGADVDGLNLAARLKDEQHLLVPQRAIETGTGNEGSGSMQRNPFAPAESAGAGGGVSGSQLLASSGSQAGGQQLPPALGRQGRRFNINTASLAELDALPGIGPALAQRIIDYRISNGPFASVEDIKKVSGIGEKKFEQIRELICVN